MLPWAYLVPQALRVWVLQSVDWKLNARCHTGWNKIHVSSPPRQTLMTVSILEAFCRVFQLTLHNNSLCTLTVGRLLYCPKLILLHISFFIGTWRVLH